MDISLFSQRINGEKYKTVLHHEQLQPIYNDGCLPIMKFPCPIMKKPKEDDDLTALKINYKKPCIKLTDKCLHELSASCPFCVEYRSFKISQ